MIRTAVTATGWVRFFLNGSEFTCRYSSDIRSVPESVLAIPLLASLAPVAWACGAELMVPEIDRVFLQSLDDIKAYLRKAYPQLPLEGRVIPGRIVDQSDLDSNSRTAMLFSGGVDSWGTLLRKKTEQPLLITVNGADVKLKWPGAWDNVRESVAGVGREHGLENALITSNFRGLLEQQMLDIEFKSHTSSWWEGIQSGMGILGLCAPLAYTHRIGHIYIATCQPNAGWPWDAQGGINNNVRWSGTTVEYEGGALTRQDKVGMIASYIRETRGTFKLRVCYKCPTGDNCGVCRKCAVTAIGLLLEGIEPREAGMPFGEEDLRQVRSKLERHEWSLQLAVSLWREIRERIPEKRDVMVPYAREFFDWFYKADLETLVFTETSHFRSGLKNLGNVYYKWLKTHGILR